MRLSLREDYGWATSSSHRACCTRMKSSHHNSFFAPNASTPTDAEAYFYRQREGSIMNATNSEHTKNALTTWNTFSIACKVSLFRKATCLLSTAA